MPLPDHYRRFFRTHLRFALIMLAVGLLTGILFQESSKKVEFSAALPAGAHLEAVLGLALVHGHTFLIGVLLPLALTWILQLSLSLGCQTLSPRSLKATTVLFLPSASVVLALMLLKGYHFVLGVRHGRAVAELGETFLGSEALRAALYGSSHTVLALSLGIFAVGVWRAMGEKRH